MHFKSGLSNRTPGFKSLIRTTILLVGLLAIIMIAPHANAAKRALVIGNDSYESVAPLTRAVSDAWTVGDTLEGLGYIVTRHANVRRRDFSISLRNFVQTLEEGDEAAFFFAGHGISINGENFLLPTDIPNEGPSGEIFIKNESFGLSDVLESFRSRKVRVSFLIVDACRNNPFKKEGTRTLGASRGLSPVLAPEGTFILYSAGVGQLALDNLGPEDQSKNSVFVRSLVPLMQTPGLTLPQVARQVRREVDKLAKRVSHEQRPAYYDELLGDIYLAGVPQTSTQAVENTPTPKPIKTPQPAETQNVFRTIPWDRSLNAPNPNGVVVADDGTIYVTAPINGGKTYLDLHGALIRLNPDGSEIGRTLLDYDEHNGLNGVIFLDDGSVGSGGSFTPKGHYSTSMAFHRFSRNGELLNQFVAEEEKALEAAVDLAQLSDGTVVLAGYTRPNGSISMGGKLIAMGVDGKQLWARAFGQKPYVIINSITALPDGGMVVLGEQGNPADSAWGARLDAKGKVLWRKDFKTAFRGREVIYSTDGSIYAVGTARDVRSSTNNLWVAKISLNGSVVSEKTFGSDGVEEGYAVVEGPRHLYVAGSTTSKGAGVTDAWLLELSKFHQLGLQRDRTVGGARGEIAEHIALLPDGGLVVTGLSDSKGGWAFAVSPNAETRKLVLSGNVTGPCLNERNWAAFVDGASKGHATVGHYYCEAEEAEPFFQLSCDPQSTSLGARSNVNVRDRFLNKKFPIKVRVDGKSFSFTATADHNEMADINEISFRVPFDHPMIEALAAGNSALVSGGGDSTKLHLKGSRAALERLKYCSAYAAAIGQ